MVHPADNLVSEHAGGDPGESGSLREETTLIEGEEPTLGKCQLPKEILALQGPVSELWELQYPLW